MEVDDMGIMLFDANCMIGQRFSPKEAKFTNSESLLKTMDSKGIDKALVFHSLAKENFINDGNMAILKEVMGQDRLIPCWVVMPHYSGECQKPEDIIKSMKDNKVKAIRIFPEYHRVKLYPWIWHELFFELEKYKVPVLVDFSNVNWSQEIDWNGINNICSEFPNLPLILLRQGQVADRYIYYLMDKHDNLYFEISYYQVNNGIYSLADKFGANRLIFGTGMPFYQPDCPINALLYSGLSEKEIKKVAYENLEKLLEGVCFID